MKYEVKTTYTFPGHYIVEAESQAEAAEIVNQSEEPTFIQVQNDSRILDWNFPSPTVKIERDIDKNNPIDLDVEMEFNLIPMNEGHELPVRKIFDGSLGKAIQDAISLRDSLQNLFPDSTVTVKIEERKEWKTLYHINDDILQDENFTDVCKISELNNNYYFFKWEIQDGENSYYDYNLQRNISLDAATTESYKFIVPHVDGSPDPTDYRFYKLIAATPIDRETFALLNNLL